MGRQCRVSRKSSETDITAELDIDGQGVLETDMEDPMMRHMLNTLVRYASWSLVLRAKGDMLHHLSEDVAITLGKAVGACIAGGPIGRFGHSVIPMDDALVEVALDISGRFYFHSDPLPEPFPHFLRSFAENARMNLHILVKRGEDSHHTAEASFKALGRAVREALAPLQSELSTKGGVTLRVE